jgi:four helix bundle protein
VGQNFKDLVAWQKAMDLVMEIYAVTEKFPREEIYGLTSQLRRAAVSIPSNVAEGQARFSKKEFKHFLRTAKGSLAEVQTQIAIARRLGFMSEATEAELEERMHQLARILNGLINSIAE